MADEDLPPEVEDAGALDAPEVEDAPQDGVEDTPQDDDPPSWEDVASGMGWSPKDKWRGDPGKWKPAHQFIADTAEINSKLAGKLTNVEKQVQAMARTSAQITEQALAKQRQELLEARKEAFEIGDADKFEQADKALNELTKTPQTQAPAPEAQDFVERHKSWFGVDQEATNWARNRAGELANQGLSPARQLAVVEKEMKDYFPDLLPQQDAPKVTPKPAPLSKPGNRGSATPKAKSFAALPPEAQKAALEFEKRGRCTKEQYAATYFEDQGS